LAFFELVRELGTDDSSSHRFGVVGCEHPSGSTIWAAQWNSPTLLSGQAIATRTALHLQQDREDLAEIEGEETCLLVGLLDLTEFSEWEAFMTPPTACHNHLRQAILHRPANLGPEPIIIRLQMGDHVELAGRGERPDFSVLVSAGIVAWHVPTIEVGLRPPIPRELPHKPMVLRLADMF
jgi:hypothetical protein